MSIVYTMQLLYAFTNVYKNKRSTSSIIMNVVLVCVGNLQEYIFTNIAQLLRLGHENIYVLTNAQLLSHFAQYNNETRVKIINVDTLNDTFRYYEKTGLNKDFRGGFWALASMRFFYIYEFMDQYNIDDVIHLENDVVVYYNCGELINKLGKQFVYIPFDSLTRNIASIIYIPSASVFKRILDNYDYNLNDMENFSQIKSKTNVIRNFPIFPSNNSSNTEVQFVSDNFDVFGYVFDAAAIGQYLGGVDPRNCAGDTRGFVNETCVIKYDQFDFIWENMNGIRKPFVLINGIKFPVFNLHIHHKNLQDFV